MKTYKEFVDLIDEKFKEAKEKKISRMSIEWGKWSADMNRELRDYIADEKNPNQLLYQYTFIYWILKSQILEIYFRNKGLILKMKIKKKMKELKEVKKILDLKLSAKRVSKEEVLKMVLGAE